MATLLVALNKPEDEHTWESIDKAIKRFHAVVRGGGAKSFPDEFVKVMKDKPIVNGLVRSVSDFCPVLGCLLHLRSDVGRDDRRVSPGFHA